MRLPQVAVGPLVVCWKDLWTGAHGLEISWRGKALVLWGFGK